MTAKHRQRQYGTLALVAGVVSATVYSVMVQVTLAHLEQTAGLVPFDLRPLGYDRGQATQLLAGLGEAGQAYYLRRQIPLDLIYPATLALTLILTNFWLGARMDRRAMLHLGNGLAVAACLADYAENLGIVLMIRGWPQVPDGVVRASSAASTAKAGLTTIAVLITLTIAAVWVVRRIRPLGRREMG